MAVSAIRKELGNIVWLPYVRYDMLPGGSYVTKTFFQNWLTYMKSNGYIGDETKFYIGITSPNSRGTVFGQCYTDGNYASFIFQSHNETVRFGLIDGTYFCSKINETAL